MVNDRERILEKMKTGERALKNPYKYIWKKNLGYKVNTIAN